MRIKKHTLRELRIKTNKKQIDVCCKLNIARNTYSQYETGKREPAINLLPKLAKILECTIEDVVLCFCND